MTLRAGLASTFEAAGQADRIQREIANMFREGSLAVLIAKYSYFGLDNTWASCEQIDAERRKHWLNWLAIGLAFAAGIVVWQASSLRQRKRAESALRESEERFRSLANTVPVMIMAAAAGLYRTKPERGTWLDALPDVCWRDKFGLSVIKTRTLSLYETRIHRRAENSLYYGIGLGPRSC
jgi:PAS domain-containing protein